MNQLAGGLIGAVLTTLSACVPVLTPEDRTMDGSGNNPDRPDMGQAFTEIMRMGPAMYEDGASMPSGAGRPSARLVSNAVCDQVEIMPNDRGLSDWVWQWGQFLDHDISLSGSMDPAEAFHIPVPAGDPFFDPAGTGGMVIPLFRTVYDPDTGSVDGNPRQQINQITAFIDASSVYGSDDGRSDWLRTHEGGRLKVSDGDLLPFNDGTQGNAGPGGAASKDPSLFVAGDPRANEQSGLTAVHTLFVREHNRLADELALENPDWSDEQIYQRARKFVGSFVQNITYREFLPAMMGPKAPHPDDAEYNPSVDGRIANEFANACYRIGHTMLSPQTLRLNPDGTPIDAGPLPLRDAFFDPSRILDEGGIEPLLLGLAGQQMQEIDPFIIDDVRNFLFGPPGSGGFDLASLNMQRGRDHGLPDYNTLRETMGLERMMSFEEISSNPAIVAGLKSVYSSVDDIDPWLGAIAEDHLEDSSVGELIFHVVGDQFRRLRDGDRFWYRNDVAFSLDEIEEIESTSLADIIRRNTEITDIQDRVFFVVE
jgi:hypothetical protein